MALSVIFYCLLIVTIKIIKQSPISYPESSGLLVSGRSLGESLGFWNFYRGNVRLSDLSFVAVNSQLKKYFLSFTTSVFLPVTTHWRRNPRTLAARDWAVSWNRKSCLVSFIYMPFLFCNHAYCFVFFQVNTAVSAFLVPLSSKYGT